MLGWLAYNTELPLPEVLYADDDLILMDHIVTGGPMAQEDAADHLAFLHSQTAERFGFDCDTVIGGLPQPNPWTDQWVDFFRDWRLMMMADAAARAGHLPTSIRIQIERLAGNLDGYFDDLSVPSLIHGDCWAGNILCRNGRVAAFVDPAIYYADPEIELAFGTLFGTFDARFFDRYAEHHPIRDGFWEARRDILNLYPLLVHVRLFGASYVAQVDAIVRRF